MASIDSEISRYTSVEYEQLADYLLAHYNKSGKGSYPLGSLIQALKSNWWSEKNIIERMSRYTDLALYKEMLFDTPLEELPVYINHEEHGIKLIAEWRLKIGK